jgi:putative Mg2+ transporter-C (MgtC) family protein
MTLSALEGAGFVPVAGKILLAYVLGLPTGWERFKHDRSAGLRTFPLVSVASCAFLLVAAQPNLDVASQSRILVGVMTGIGFIGGGSIIKEADSVHGTATAAGLWNMGAIGAAVAFGNYGLAVLLCVLNYVTLLVMSYLEKKVKKDFNV